MYIYIDRKKVLKHHPDKKVSSATPPTNSLQFSGINTNDDAFFKCIQKAHEVLSHPEKRRQFDSVDPTFIEWEEDLPSSSVKVIMAISPGLLCFKTMNGSIKKISNLSPRLARYLSNIQGSLVLSRCRVLVP
jgi:hypothetical protein